jgi:uncharacterized RDD family membrane protein YckC
LLSGLIDYFVPWVIASIFFRINAAIGVFVWLATLAWILYQQYQAGITGQSIGRKTIGLRLLGEQTGQPIGGGMAIGRYFLHILDALPCYLGYLWPIWDPMRQTFSDKILHTVVIVA